MSTYLFYAGIVWVFFAFLLGIIFIVPGGGMPQKSAAVSAPIIVQNGGGPSGYSGPDTLPVSVSIRNTPGAEDSIPVEVEVARRSRK